MENTLLNLIPAAYLPEIHLSQYDVGRTITFTLKDGASDYSVPSGASVKVKATKPSGFGFEVACTFNGGTVTLVTTDTMTPENGRFPAELSIVSGNTTIGTSNFIFNIERSPHPEGTIDGDAETILPELTLLVERIEAAADSVDEDTQIVTDAKAEVLQAKADTLQAKADTLSARDESVSAKDLAVSSAETSVEASERAEELIGSVSTKADAIVKTASGEIASFTDGGDELPMKSLKVNIVPKQSGSGDPSPSNVRPISGTDTVNIFDTGINLWDEEWIRGIMYSSGTAYAEGNGIMSKNFCPCLPNTEYYANQFVCWYDINKTFISRVSAGVRTSPSNAYYFKITTNDRYGTTYNNDIVVNYPSADTSYHSGKDNESYPISLGQTVYGGTLDVVSGKLKKYPYYSSYNGETLSGRWICDRAVYSQGTTPPNGSQVVDMSGQGTELTLTPTEVKTLLGQNNIWANSGSVEVEYRADTTLAYNELVAMILENIGN